MKVLLTGANGYIGTRLLQSLAQKGHEIVALARIPSSVDVPERIRPQVTVIQGDLTQKVNFPQDIDAAYYLVHSMRSSKGSFDQIDRAAAHHFLEALKQTQCKQVIYLTGIITTNKLSKHLQSRLEVEKILKRGLIPVTVFRAGIIIGAGSASFEIIRDLTEKLPIMVAPKWIQTRCQPIAIRDVIFYLTESLGHEKCIGQTFDIGGPDILTYKEMLYGYAKVRKLHRLIITVPVLTPNLSSYWLVFVTSTSFFLARALIDSMTIDVVCTEQRIHEILPRQCLDYRTAIQKALDKIKENAVISSWRDSWSASGINTDYHDYIEVPTFGCYKMKASKNFQFNPDKVYKQVYKIGGNTGYFYMDWAWRMRGLIDRFLGGVGLRRGRTSRETLRAGDAIDFWRVIQIDREHRHLILFAEMKVPGEAWLEFHVHENSIDQIATFRPRGLFGRFYWWLFYPVHLIMFPGMLRSILKDAYRSI
ncbi:MAG: SDR family oxidoreductase [Chlamydiia bacterium]|nr:SDR family oxidoreductase [Chlamydiia bacterium]